MTTVAEKPKHFIKLNHVYLFLISLILLSGIFFTYKMYTHLNTLEQQLKNTTQTIKQQQITDAKQTDYELNVTRTFETLLDKKITALNQTVHNAMQQRWYQANDWLLLKARYYLELAEINAHWSDNTETSINLLQQADTILSTIHDERLLSIRQTIANEISQLQQLTPIDFAGILSQLDALQLQIKSLALKPSIQQNQSKDASKHQDNPLNWRDRLKTSLTQLEKLVIIQHHDDTLQSLFTPAYESMLRENIRLNIQQAQWAVIQQNEAVFKLALTQTLRNINRAFDLNQNNAQTLIKQLKQLEEISLQHQRLPIDQSLRLLNQFIELRISEQKSPEKQEPSA